MSVHIVLEGNTPAFVSSVRWNVETFHVIEPRRGVRIALRNILVLIKDSIWQYGKVQAAEEYKLG